MPWHPDFLKALLMEQENLNKSHGYIIWEVGGLLMEDAKAALDLLLPRSCIVCGKTLTSKERHLCIYCEADLPLTHYWERRRNPMADKVNAILQQMITDELSSTGPAGCPEAIQHLKYSYAAALFFYHGENMYKHIPQRLKYMGDIGEGRFYAGMLGELMKDSRYFNDIDLVIPVPLHWARRWKRGYNQAEVIARAIAQELGSPVRTDLLVRRKSTRTQTRLDVGEKQKNVQGAFALSRKAEKSQSGKRRLHGLDDSGRHRHVLIVDDVLTTGATMAECMEVLQPYFGRATRLSCATLGFVNNG